MLIANCFKKSTKRVNRDYPDPRDIPLVGDSVVITDDMPPVIGNKDYNSKGMFIEYPDTHD